ncbi:mitochondrial cardiolipin hydrolase-like [Ostrinia furnacalis]|uniref:mitochondrial cardiolipin hydrolase-like n=1 Tax=Ostrinia furnacalis TaxID=93504 RepID=UPI00103E4BEB|nr:mitochondrial cardiolipin hydrolase-like [Ostrinia furnacalis]
MEYINWKNGLFISGPMLCGLAFKLIKKRIDRKYDYSFNEVLFYGDSADEEKVKKTGLNNLYCINFVLSNACRSVDVCVPSLESETITKCLINVHLKNKAKVRIAIHNSDQFGNLKSLAQHGIEVKVIKSERIEHEFALIDACEATSDGLAVMGSLDYETARVNCNKDMTMLTSQPEVVTNLQREFNRIWNSTPDVFGAKEGKPDLMLNDTR